MPQLYANYFPYIFVYCSASFRYRFTYCSGYRSIGATIGAKFVFISATISATIGATIGDTSGDIGVILVTLLVTTSDLMIVFSMTQCFFYDIGIIFYDIFYPTYIEISARIIRVFSLIPLYQAGPHAIYPAYLY